MSGTTIDLQATIARIDRDLAESAKLRDESQKFVAEERKLMAEERKLQAEATKLHVDRWIAPLMLATVTVLGGILGFVSALVTALHMGAR